MQLLLKIIQWFQIVMLTRFCSTKSRSKIFDSDMPRIPMLADGGITHSLHLATIDEKELIVPLNKLQQLSDMPILVERHTDQRKQIKRMSWHKKKSQSKNWRKWRERRLRRS